MAEKKSVRFTDLTIEDRVEYDTADHEVFLSFRNDDDALAFREWWEADGAIMFGEHLADKATGPGCTCGAADDWASCWHYPDCPMKAVEG